MSYIFKVTFSNFRIGRGEPELPCEARGCADNHAGNRAREVRPAPEEREQNQRAEGSTEAAPREGDHLHDDLEEVAAELRDNGLRGDCVPRLEEQFGT